MRRSVLVRALGVSALTTLLVPAAAMAAAGSTSRATRPKRTARVIGVRRMDPPGSSAPRSLFAASRSVFRPVSKDRRAAFALR